MSGRSAWCVLSGLLLVLAAGCEKEAGQDAPAPQQPAAQPDPPDQPDQPAEPAKDSAAADEGAAEIDEAELRKRVSQAESRLEFMRSRQTVEMKKRPKFVEMAKVLIKAGADHIGYLMSPDGKRFGLTAHGSGKRFGRTVAELVGATVNKQAGKKVLTMAGFNDWGGVYYSMQFGTDPIARAGVEGLSRTQIEVALEEEGVPAAEIERLLAPAAGGGKVMGMGLIIDPHRDIAYSVATMPGGDVAALGIDKKAVAGAPVIVERMVGFKELTLVHRPGLEGQALAEWQAQHGGFGGKAAKRLASIHVSLGTEKPQSITWEAGKLADTVVYNYAEKTSEMGAK
jgi:hypothetical protein